jgi:hypothetical protein
LASSTCAVLAAALLAPGAAVAAATRAEYAAQADPICAAADADIAKLNKRFRRLHRQGRYRPAGRVLGKTGARLASSVEDVRAIPPPPGDETTVATWLSLIDGVASNNRRMGRAEAHRRFNAVFRLQLKNSDLHRQAAALMGRWGFRVCAPTLAQ